MDIFNGNAPSKELFVFLKYNTIPQNGTELKLSEVDNELYKEFANKMSVLRTQLEEGTPSAKATISAIFSMFGFNRHYCSMTGQPIIGKYFKIGGKIVSKEAYEAHKIIQELEKKEEQAAVVGAEKLAQEYMEDK